MKTRILKPAKCESKMIAAPIAPCEILPAGLAGSMELNGQVYTVEILGYLPDVGEPIIDGYRLTKGDGTAHDLCIVAGRLECTCGDYEFRRAVSQDAALSCCKHGLAVKAHLQDPRDQHEPATATVATSADDGRCICGMPRSHCDCWF